VFEFTICFRPARLDTPEEMVMQRKVKLSKGGMDVQVIV
jgi:hypothetical protein